MASSSSAETFPSARVEDLLGLNYQYHMDAKPNGGIDVWLVYYGPPSQTDPDDPATWHSGIGVTTYPVHGELAIEKGFKTVVYLFPHGTTEAKLANIAAYCSQNPKDFGQWVCHAVSEQKPGTILRALESRPDREVEVLSIPGDPPAPSKIPFESVDVEYVFGIYLQDKIDGEPPVDQPDPNGNFWVAEYRKKPLVLDGRYDSGQGVTTDIDDAMRAWRAFKTSGEGRVKFKAYKLTPFVEPGHGLPDRLYHMGLLCDRDDSIMFGSRQIKDKPFLGMRDCVWTSQNLISAMERAEAEKDTQLTSASSDSVFDNIVTTLLTLNPENNG
ncbi:hypothetical protein HBH68_200750 [Parastagonospora nodorum]|nr:hypothetical protein HBH68_200750 [Parastagonospora nodorum]KAH5349951.1 hypothetical protein HBI48_170700 [Parastagonospora nodorum]